jgi:GAF domain
VEPHTRAVISAQPLFRIASPLDVAQLGAIQAHDEVVLLFGPGAAADDVNAALEALGKRTRCTSIVLTTRERMADFQPLVDADRLFYLSCGDLPEPQLAALIDSARGTSKRDASADVFLPPEDLRRMATAGNVAEVADAVERAIGGAIETRRSRCVLFDRERQTLWCPADAGEEASAAVGLASFIVRTGMTVCLERLAGDPRADLELDNPDGDPSDRFLGVPVCAPRGAIVAVLIALRPHRDPAFEPAEVAMLEALAAHASPYLATWLVQTSGSSPFRHNALRELDQPLLAGPEPLRLDGAWTRGTSWLAAAAFAAVLLALVFALGLGHG